MFIILPNRLFWSSFIEYAKKVAVFVVVSKIIPQYLPQFREKIIFTLFLELIQF